MKAIFAEILKNLSFHFWIFFVLRYLKGPCDKAHESRSHANAICEIRAQIQFHVTLNRKSNQKYYENTLIFGDRSLQLSTKITIRRLKRRIFGKSKMYVDACSTNIPTYPKEITAVLPNVNLFNSLLLRKIKKIFILVARIHMHTDQQPRSSNTKIPTVLRNKTKESKKLSPCTHTYVHTHMCLENKAEEFICFT